MSNAGIIVSPCNAQIFTNSLIGDMLIFTSSNSQRLLIGTNSNSVASLMLSSNASYFNNGNVGINNSNPAYTLDVTGTIRASSNITTSNLQVSGGTIQVGSYGSVFNSIIAFNYAIGASANGTNVGVNGGTGFAGYAFNIPFPVTYTNTSKLTINYSIGDTNPYPSDMYTTHMNGISSTSVNITVQRTDANGWGSSTLTVYMTVFELH